MGLLVEGLLHDDLLTDLQHSTTWWHAQIPDMLAQGSG
jgi:hypothetical protein